MIDNFVTGSSGFIGKHLMAKLVPPHKASNLGVDTIAIPHDDIVRPVFWMMPCRKFFFLSAYGNMPDQTNPSRILASNVGHLGVILVQMLVDKMVPESFVYMSSSSVNLHVQTPYSRTKRAGEEMVLAMPIPGLVIRPYSCTGVGEQKEHLIPTLIRACMEGTPVDLVYDAVHDYIDVEDVVESIIKLSSKGATGIVELGSGKPTTNEEVLSIVESVTGRKANVRKVDSLRPYDNHDWYCRNPWSNGTKRKSLINSIREMVAVYERLET